MSAAEKIEKARQERIARESQQVVNVKKPMDWITWLVCIASALAVCFGLFFLGKMGYEYWYEHKAERALVNFRNKTDAGLTDLPDDASDVISGLVSQHRDAKTPTAEQPVVIEVSEEYLARLRRVIDFDTLLSESPNATRWLWVPGSENIDYYVMQEQEIGVYKYLWADLYGNRNGTGSLLTPHIPGDLDTAHLLIFGHHMNRRNSMFSNLMDWRDSAKAEKDPYAMVYYPDHAECWKIWTAMNVQAHDLVYTIPSKIGTQGYQELIDWLDEHGLYHMCDKPDANTRLLVLSTCDKGRGNQDTRFITVYVPDIFYYYDTQTLSIGPLENIDD